MTITYRRYCFNTQPRGGGCEQDKSTNSTRAVSTHSRAEAAAYSPLSMPEQSEFQHTAARRRLLKISYSECGYFWFQHTAARRRLPDRRIRRVKITSFNTQPRGGGCPQRFYRRWRPCGFNTQPRGGGCRLMLPPCLCRKRFQHTAARRRLPRAGARRR